MSVERRVQATVNSRYDGHTRGSPCLSRRESLITGCEIKSAAKNNIGNICETRTILHIKKN